MEATEEIDHLRLHRRDLGGTQDDTRVDDKIRSFVNKMTTEVYGDLGVRCCTIQFIHFGENQYARERLRRLDDELSTEEFPNFP